MPRSTATQPYPAARRAPMPPPRNRSLRDQRATRPPADRPATVPARQQQRGPQTAPPRPRLPRPREAPARPAACAAAEARSGSSERRSCTATLPPAARSRTVQAASGTPERTPPGARRRQHPDRRASRTPPRGASAHAAPATPRTAFEQTPPPTPEHARKPTSQRPNPTHHRPQPPLNYRTPQSAKTFTHRGELACGAVEGRTASLLCLVNAS